MAAFDDVNLDRSDEWPAPPAKRRRGIAAAALVLVIAAAVLVWWLTTRRSTPEPVEMAAPASPPSSLPLAAAPRTTTLPPLGELDPAFRELVRALTSSALVERWLATTDLARQTAALVHGAATGRTPLRLLSPLRPGGAFQVLERSGRTVIAPASHARFNAMADVIVSVDPRAVAEAYRTLIPRLEDAHDELGAPETSFDASFTRVLTQLIDTPVPDGPIAVVPRGGLYVFADPSLESLTSAQKLLLRSGPDNARRIQQRLRELREALSAPAPGT